MYIKSILNDSGKDYFWLNQNEIPTNISMSVKFKLMELHSTSWKHSTFDSPKCSNNRIFKEDFTLENTSIFCLMIYLWHFAIFVFQIIELFVLLLYVPSQQLWSLRDGQFT